MTHPPSYRQLEHAFDHLAPVYETVYGPHGNRVMAGLRQKNLAVLEAEFPPGARLLEIGCGVGEEAVYLARRGRVILATDVSPAMVGCTVRRAARAGLSHRITGLAIPAGQLDALRPRLPFDGAYASFGPLNCEPALPRLSAALFDLLSPGAVFVCSVMARWCPFEIGWFLLHLRPRQAFRRLGPGWHEAGLSGTGERRSVPVRYFTPRRLAREFRPYFLLERSLALGLLWPPPWLDHLYRRHSRLFDRLEPWETRLSGSFPWRMMGDHILLVFRRRE